MPVIGNSKLETAETNSVRSGDTKCPSYDDASQQLLRGSFEDFDIEAQRPQHRPRLGNELRESMASMKEMQIQEIAISASPKLAELFAPCQSCVAPVLVVIQKLLYFAFLLFLGALGMVVVWTILIGISVAMSKLAMVALWIWEKVGLL